MTVISLLNLFCFFVISRNKIVIKFYFPQYFQTETSRYSLKFDFNSSNQDVACFKLETILAAAGRKKYDILSINKKDNEYAILKSIPFSDFQFEVISIEFDTDFLSGQHKVEELLQSHNYTGWQQFTHHPFKKRDLVFVRKQ